jgi:hypothetical protein
MTSIRIERSRPDRRLRASGLLRAVRGPHGESWRAAWRIFLLSRLLVFAVSVFAVLSMSPVGTEGGFNAGEPPFGPGHPFQGWFLGGFLDALLPPLSRWDAGNFLQIAHNGYGSGASGGAPGLTAFFPLYPALVWVVAHLLGASNGAFMFAGFAVSLIAFLVALYVLHRLVSLELGPRVADAATLLLAIFPGALYFSAPYSESLFLACSVSSFYMARRGRWAWAGLLGALASATRLIGITLVVPLLVLYLYGPRSDSAPRATAKKISPRYRLCPDILWVGLTAAGLAAYSLYLQVVYSDPLGWYYAQKTAFARVRSFPLVTMWDGAVAAWHAIRALRRWLNTVPTGSGWNWENAQAMIALLEFAVLVFLLVALVWMAFRLPLAYTAYGFAMLIVLLSSKILIFPPNDIGRPFQSFHRFAAVLFPVYIWLGLVSEERNLTPRVAAVFATFLGLLTAMFATRHWLV